jgi:Malectin domain
MRGFQGGSTFTTTAAIAGTTDDRLYQTSRYGNFSYAIPVPNGDYLVTLKFTEVSYTKVGQRVFDVLMEGAEVLNNLDLVDEVGPKVAYDVTLPVHVTDGVLNIGFRSVVNSAKVNGIVIMGGTGTL